MPLLRLNETKCVFMAAALISILLSIWMSTRSAIINPDAVCYLQSADMIGSGGLKAAIKVCSQAKWPFFSFIVYEAGHYLHLSYTTAAFFLDSLFSLISVLTFIYIIKLLGANNRTLWLGAAVILLAHEFNSVREYIVRDHGFWALYLVSIAALIRYVQSYRIGWAWIWSLCLFVAFLFRVEGIVFLSLVPVVLLVCRQIPFKAFLALNTLSLMGALGLGFLLLNASQHDLGRLPDLFNQVTHSVDLISYRYTTSVDSLKYNVLSQFAEKDASTVFVLMLIVWYFQSVVTNLSLIYAGLFIFAVYKKILRVNISTLAILYTYMALNILLTALFLTENLFISKRYLIALSLLFMLWVPFALEKIIQNRKQYRYALPMVIVLIALSSVGGVVDFGYSKTYVRDAGEWIAANLPHNANIYSNDEMVMYYSKLWGNDIFKKAPIYTKVKDWENGKWSEFDYVVLALSKKERYENEMVKEIKYPPMKSFVNKRGDAVLIYQICDRSMSFEYYGNRCGLCRVSNRNMSS